MSKKEKLRPMSEFDPTKLSRVHDALNDKTFVWRPDWAAHYRQHARKGALGIVEWDGLLLDGWSAGEVIEFT